MSSQKPIIVVLGATGNQGGSVITHFLSLPSSPYTIRGVTRNTSSANAKRLESLGVEVAAGDFDDPASLDAAFQGASVIFSNTDFWQSYFNPAIRERASATGQSAMVFSKGIETQQNKNIIDAAAKIKTLDRLVYSSLPYTNKLSGGKYSHVHHFDGKAIAEEYGKATYPDLWAKTTVLYAGYYLENNFSPAGSLYRPKLNKAKDTLVLAITDPMGATLLPMFSSVDDTGPLVHAVLQAAPGQKIIGANEWLDYRQFATILAKVLGKKIEFVKSNPVLTLGDPELEQDYGDMLGWYVEFGFDGASVDPTVKRLPDLGIDAKLATVAEWCAKQNWEKVLEVVE